MPEDLDVDHHRPTPLQLRELFFPKISVTALTPESGGPEGPGELDLDLTEIGFQFRKLDEEPTIANAAMRLRTLPLGEGDSDSRQRYALDIEVFAVFELTGNEQQDPMAEYLREVSAAFALLGSIREQVAMSTARGPWGVLTVPLVAMDRILGRPPPSPTKKP